MTSALDYRAKQQRYKLVPYINKVHLMESQNLAMLERYASQFEAFPDVHVRINHFLEKTEHHLAYLEALLDAYNEQPPLAPPSAAFLSEGTPASQVEEALPNIATRDIFDEYFFTHFEIGAYMILGTLARAYGDEMAVAIVGDILQDKFEMERWMIENLPEITLRSLAEEGEVLPESAWRFARRPALEGFKFGTIASFNASTV
jgi:ferritin-like metal-binding protein YciE